MELLEIQKLPTAENSAIHLHPSDNAAIARVPLSPGQKLRIEGNDFVARTAVPAGHKIALMNIAPGEYIYRYGQRIGRASKPIAAGEHIHTHNVAFEELSFDYEFPVDEKPFPAPPAN
ncbi:MAG: UxaA family hydrolase, partial [Acidobacteriota bacterium]|nr:UxaA family hydrolase [Acidobacteriota bacterium]